LRRHLSLGMVPARVAVCLLAELGLAWAVPRDDCWGTYPKPTITFDHVDAQGRVCIPVVNWKAYPNEPFRKAPELPPCGANAWSARTWVDIYDADTHARIYGFCAFGTNADLEDIWFKPSVKKGRVYNVLDDRACKRQYKATGSHLAAGRVLLYPARNWGG
jgi:hypothetical protein